MTIEERVHGGKIFRECWNMIESEASGLTPAAAENFWQSFQDAMREKFPDRMNAPFSQAEWSRLFTVDIPFGQYPGKMLGDVFDAGGNMLDYLVWLANRTFIDDLRRFLKHPKLVALIEKRNQNKFREFHEDDESGNQFGD